MEACEEESEQVLNGWRRKIDGESEGGKEVDEVLRWVQRR